MVLRLGKIERLRMADRFPYFRFFPERFMAGIRGLNANEVKVYICLLCRIYESGGPIRRNDVVLSTYCEMRPSSFTKAMSRLLALEKFQERDGLLSNAAADEEISWRASKSQKSARAGKVSAEKRQQTQSASATDVQRTSTNREEEGEREDSSPNGEEIPRKRAIPAYEPLLGLVSEEQARGFFDHRKALRKPMTARATTILRNTLQDIAAEGGDPGEALDMAVERGWQAIKADWFFNAKETTNAPRRQAGGDPGFRKSLEFWEEYDRRKAGAGDDAGGATPGDEPGDGEAGELDREASFGPVVPLFRSGR